MKALILALLVATPALAGTASLKDNMKALAEHYGAIRETVGDRAHNAANAERAKKMAELLRACLALTPDSIAQLPPQQRAAALAEYKKLMAQVATDAEALHAAFQAGDNRAAADLASKMNLGRREGHDKFKK